MLPQIAMGSRPFEEAAATALMMQDQEVVVDESRPHIVMGRAEENDLVVKGNLISRLHARIEVSATSSC
jgi:adenylate cyclase